MVTLSDKLSDRVSNFKEMIMTKKLTNEELVEKLQEMINESTETINARIDEVEETLNEKIEDTNEETLDAVNELVEALTVESDDEEDAEDPEEDDFDTDEEETDEEDTDRDECSSCDGCDGCDDLEEVEDDSFLTFDVDVIGDEDAEAQIDEAVLNFREALTQLYARAEELGYDTVAVSVQMTD
jgi:methionyl-tRNA synthetase